MPVRPNISSVPLEEMCSSIAGGAHKRDTEAGEFK